MLLPKDLTAPSPSSWLSVEVVDRPEQFARLRGEWSGLHDASEACVFLSWEWLYPWFRRIAPERGLHLLTARDRTGQLVGLLPLSVERRRAFGRSIRRLGFLGDVHVGSDYLDVIARPEVREEVTRAFAAALRENARADVIDLTDLSESSPTLAIFREVFAGPSFELRQTERSVCPFETFEEGQTFDSFLKKTARKDNYLRRKKWLEKQPEYRVERTERPGELSLPLAEFFRLHAARWADDGGSQGIKGCGVQAFHRDAAALLAERGWLRMYTMSLEGKAVASVYGIIHRHTFLYFQSGYDPAYRSKSVGLVLVGETFKDALGMRLRAYDFLRGTEAYKSDWTSRTRKTVALRIWPKSGVGRLLTQEEAVRRAASGLAKRMLPARWVEAVRRLRRRRAAID